MGFVADSVAVFGDGRTSGFFDPIIIIAHGGLGVCDGAHRYFVMKKGQRSGCGSGDARGTRRSIG